MSARATILDSSSPSVLVIRLDAIGDALALTPLLAAFARAEIPVDMVLRHANLDAFTPAAVRRRYVAPFALRSNRPENRAAIATFGAELRANRYTHVLVATEDPGGYLLARAVAAPHRIGFVNGWTKPFKTLWLRTMLTTALYRAGGLDPRAPHECNVLFELGRTLVHETAPTRDVERLRPLVIEREIPPTGATVVQITDKWERLGMAFEDVVRALHEAQAYGPVRAISSATESAYADRIEHASGVTVHRFDDLASWKAEIAAARALVAPDSGAIHVAGMTGTPVVAVFPPIALYALQTARWTPWAAPSRIVRADDQWPAAAAEALRWLLDTEARAR